MSDPGVTAAAEMPVALVAAMMVEDAGNAAMQRNFRPARHRMSVRACQSAGGMQDCGMEQLMTS